MTTSLLMVSWGTSRGRETDGYPICRLDDTNTGKRYRCMGGGYDMIGTVFAEWLEDMRQDDLRAIGSRAYYHGTTAGVGDLYGMRWRPDGSVSLDGGCGLDAMVRIARECRLTVERKVNRRGDVIGFLVTSPGGDQ